MNMVSILLIGLAMSTDAFAAALGKGAAMCGPRWSEAVRIGLIFGAVEAITPIIGWHLGAAASRYIEAWDHWIAFGLLGALGLHMIYKAFTGHDAGNTAAARTGLMAVALTGLATSIDALAVGVGLAFVEVNIILVASVIGLCTLIMVTLGVMAGRALGSLLGRRAEMAGGIVLIMVGATILHDHLKAATV